MAYQINVSGESIKCAPESITVGMTVRSRLFQTAELRDAGKAWNDFVGVVEAIEVDGVGDDAFISFEIRTESKMTGADVFVDGRTGLSVIEII